MKNKAILFSAEARILLLLLFCSIYIPLTAQGLKEMQQMVEADDLDGLNALFVENWGMDVPTILLEKPSVFTFHKWWPMDCKEFNIIKYLIDNGQIPYDLPLENGRNYLMAACACGDLEFVKFYIEKNRIDLDVQDENGSTLLMHAAEASDTNVLMWLLSNEGDINVTNKQGETVLSVAIQNPNFGLNVIRMLIEDKNANPNIRDEQGQTLFEQTWNPRLPWKKTNWQKQEVLRPYLLKLHIDDMKKGNEIPQCSFFIKLVNSEDTTMLNIAAPIVEKFNKYKKKCGFLTDYILSRLSYKEVFVAGGEIELSKLVKKDTSYLNFLFDLGFDFENNVDFAIAGADILREYSELFDFLLLKGLDINYVDSKNRTMLSFEFQNYAWISPKLKSSESECRKLLKTMKHLVRIGAKIPQIDDKDIWNHLLIKIVQEGTNVEGLQILLEDKDINIDLKYKDKKGLTALDYAKKLNRGEMGILLLADR